MKKIFITLTLFLAAPVFAAVELDVDRNGATDISRGGTNSTTISGAKANLGIPSTLSALADDTTHRVVTDAQIGIWDSKQPALTAGSDYLTPNGSAANLTNFPATLATDSEVSAAVAGKESSLGNPSTSGWCLQSTNGGVRSWGVCGGLADATVDSKTYGRKDSTWVEVLSASDVVTFTAISPLSYNPVTGAASINLTTDLSATITANDSVPSAFAVKTLFNSLSITGTGFNPTYLTTDPVASDANGVYVNKTTGHVWYIDDPGKTDISAGTFTAWDTDPATFGFNTVTNADAGITYWSDPYTVTDIDRTAPISATAPYKINGGTPTTDSGFVSLNDTVSVSAVASTTPGATVTENATIGGVTGSPAFSVTTTSTITKAYETETFTASNNVALTAGGLWTEQVAPNGTFYDYLRVYNNVVVAAANRTGSAYRSNVAFSPNQKACATVVIAGTGGPGARMSTTVGDDSGYSVFADTDNKYLLRTLVHGSATSLLSPDVTMTAGDVVCVSASGDNPVLVTMSVSRGGSSIYSDTYPDSSANRHITGQPGMRLKRATYDVRYDNWTGEDL